jgi:hypothetical protein
MSPEAVLLVVFVAVALGYAAGRKDRADLGPMREWLRRQPPFGDPDPAASTAASPKGHSDGGMPPVPRTQGRRARGPRNALRSLPGGAPTRRD